MTVKRMTNSEVLINFIKNHVKEFDTAESGLEALRMLTGAIDKRINMFDELSEVFRKYDMMENWVECPRCISLVLLNYKDCNICDFPLLGAVEEPEPKTTLQKVKKLTPSGKSVVAEPTHDEDGVEYEDEEEVEKPKKVKKVDEAKSKKVKKVVKPVKVEVEESDEEEVPDDEEVKEMGKRELAILIEKEELDINVKKDYKGRSTEVLNDLRDAVCEELDEKYGEEEEEYDEALAEIEPDEEEEEEEEVEVEKPKKVKKSKKVAAKKTKKAEPVKEETEEDDEYELGEFGFGEDDEEDDD